MPDVTRAREFAVRARAQMRGGNHHAAIVMLARAFQPLSDADGLDPWHPGAFYLWSLDDEHLSDAERECARFVLDVWDSATLDELDDEHGGMLGHFDAVGAMAHWDHAHRAAFATWVGNPWWP